MHIYILKVADCLKFDKAMDFLPNVGKVYGHGATKNGYVAENLKIHAEYTSGHPLSAYLITKSTKFNVITKRASIVPNLEKECRTTARVHQKNVWMQ